MTVAAPQELIDFVRRHPREETVLEHGFTLNADWWSARLEGVPGAPVLNDDRNQGTGRISRGGIFKLADEAVNDESGAGAFRLLWHSLHWGTSNSNRGNQKRIDSLTMDHKVNGVILQQAADASRKNAKAAFHILKPGFSPTIKHLGPGFLTKFLYFAGGGDPEHPCLIVDSRVLRTLNTEREGTSRFKYLFGYGVNTYVEALKVLKDWARAASEEVGRPVAADEVERWAFDAKAATR